MLVVKLLLITNDSRKLHFFSVISEVIRWIIKMKTPFGPIDVNIAPRDTIKRMKEVIQRVRGIPMDQYELIFNQNVLHDDTTLLQNKLMSGDTISLVPRLGNKDGKYKQNKN